MNETAAPTSTEKRAIREFRAFFGVSLRTAIENWANYRHFQADTQACRYFRMFLGA